MRFPENPVREIVLPCNDLLETLSVSSIFNLFSHIPSEDIRVFQVLNEFTDFTGRPNDTSIMLVNVLFPTSCKKSTEFR